MKKVFALLLTLAMVLTLAACGGGSGSGSNSSGGGSSAPSGSASAPATGGESSGGSEEKTFTPSGKTLNVGVQSNIISIPTVYAYEHGYYQELGLDVNLIMFPNGSPENEGLAAEQLDVASNGLASVYSMASGLCDWIGESDSGSATLSIYMRPDCDALNYKGQIAGKPNMYGSAESLKGLRVLGPTSTMEQWAAASYFSQFGLEAGADYEYLNMDRAAAAQAVITGEGDVFVATDVDYANMMENAGFIKVADCADATGTNFNNGFLARKDILKDRYDDVVLFLQAMYRAADDLQDPEVRNAFAYQYYSENGKPATPEDVAYETEIRPFLTVQDIAAPDFYLGSGALQVGAFFASIGTIEEDQVAIIEEAINPQPMIDAFGLNIKGAALN
ncbi:MAG: ABC transporter substrate-binding protein [Oscillibacter sp.]|nr:ABC transporter substrate-binding protein [Oscillibacter sp.]